jgi:uncharacterized repeat protein (TIGR02543 family)
MKKFKRLMSAVLTFALVASTIGAGGAENREISREPDWNEAGLRLQAYMEEYADCPETLAMLRDFEARFYNELVGFNPDIREDVLNSTDSTRNSFNVVPPWSCGDVDGDGKIELADALQIQRYVINETNIIVLPTNDGKRARTAALICRHRHNPPLERHTGSIDLGDSTQITRFVIGLSSFLQTCNCGVADISRRSIVKFNLNGGTSNDSTATRVVANNARLDSVGALPIPTRAGHAFVGWFLDPASNGTGGEHVTGERTIPARTSDIVLLARWTRMPQLTYMFRGTNPPRDVSSGYGLRGDHWSGNTFHKGVDINAARHTILQSVGSGFVTHAGTSSLVPEVGRYVVINLDATHPTTGRRLRAAYAHLEGVSVGVSPTNRINAGVQIGTVGNSGTPAVDVHLCFRIITNETNFPASGDDYTNTVNPLQFFATALSTANPPRFTSTAARINRRHPLDLRRVSPNSSSGTVSFLLHP